MITNTNTTRTIGKIGKYTLTEPLGESHLFPTYLAKKEGSSDSYVVKVMDTNDAAFSNECAVFGLPEHKNVIKLEESITDAIQLTSGSKTGTKHAIVMKYMENGDLFNYLLQGPVSNEIARYLFGQLLDAIEHLHSNDYCHLDIKLENILLDDDFSLKLTDFGFATKIDPSKPLTKSFGTPSCNPPEMWLIGFELKGYDGAKADIFQLGALLYILIVGVPAFKEANSNDIWYKFILAEKWDAFWSNKEKAYRKKCITFDEDFKDLISMLLCADASMRPTIAEIRSSAWFKKIQPASTTEYIAEMQRRKALMK